MFKLKRQCFFPLTRLPLAAIATVMLSLCSGSVAHAQAGDEFEGAVWQFGMTPKVRGDEALRGAFRVADHKIFQKSGRDDERFERPAGTNFPKGRTTRVEFKDMVAFKTLLMARVQEDASNSVALRLSNLMSSANGQGDSLTAMGTAGTLSAPGSRNSLSPRVREGSDCV